jgi:hypothetical protein
MQICTTKLFPSLYKYVLLGSTKFYLLVPNELASINKWKGWLANDIPICILVQRTPERRFLEAQRKPLNERGSGRAAQPTNYRFSFQLFAEMKIPFQLLG